MSLGKRVAEKEVFGEKVHIRTLSGGKMAAEIIDLLQQVEGKPSLIIDVGAMLVVACLCDQEGERLYKDDQLEEVKNEAAIGFLTEFVEAALDHSGLNDDADDLRKNLQAVQ